MAVGHKAKLPELSDKRKRFAEEYLVDYNATRAAIRAGYSPRSADVTGSRLLANARVRAYIDARIAEQDRRTGIRQERIMRELARVAFLDPTRLADMDSGRVFDSATEDDRAAIQAIKVKTFESADGSGGVEREIRFADKLKALELLGKRYAMWVEKQEVDLTAKVEIVDDIPAAEGD